MAYLYPAAVMMLLMRSVAGRSSARTHGPNTPGAALVGEGLDGTPPVQTVDVIVVAYNSATDLPGCLENVRGQGPARVIVVDNHSRDGSAEVARESGADEVVQLDRNLGFAAGVDRGLAASGSPLVLLLNPDARLQPGALRWLVQALAGRPDCVLAGPVLIDPHTAARTGARRFSTALNRSLPLVPVLHRLAPLSAEYPEAVYEAAAGTREVDYLWGAALLCRRSFLDSIGGLDERFFMYSEDEDLGLQARSKGGCSLLVTTAAADHAGGASSEGMKPLAEARKAWATAQLLHKWRGRLAPCLFSWLWCLAFSLQWLIWTAKGMRAEGAAARAALRAYRLQLALRTTRASGRPRGQGA